MADAEKAVYLFGHQETAGDIQIHVIVMDIQTVYLLYQYRAPHKEDISHGIWKNVLLLWLARIVRVLLDTTRALLLLIWMEG